MGRLLKLCGCGRIVAALILCAVSGVSHAFLISDARSFEPVRFEIKWEAFSLEGGEPIVFHAPPFRIPVIERVPAVRLGSFSIFSFGGFTDFGSYCDPKETTPVPEPSALALLAVGLIGLGVGRRKQRFPKH